MTTREEIKKGIRHMIICFPNYEPVLDGSPNVVDVFFETFEKYPADAFQEGIVDACKEPNRKFAPSVGEIIHAIKEIPFKGMSASDRFDKENGLRPIHEVLREMGIYDQDDEVQRQKYLKSQAEKELHHE